MNSLTWLILIKICLSCNELCYCWVLAICISQENSSLPFSKCGLTMLDISVTITVPSESSLLCLFKCWEFSQADPLNCYPDIHFFFGQVACWCHCCSVAQLCLTLWSHGLQHIRPPCLSQSPRACLNPHPLDQRCHPTILSSVVPFSRLQSFPASGFF